MEKLFSLIRLVHGTAAGKIVKLRLSLQLRAGMSSQVNLFELFQTDLRVNLGGSQLGMAEHLLNEANISAAFKHQSRHCVPEKMT